ncbi:TonB-dependent receptor [Sphingosinicella terrae]|uniref:TonB-dependent receptor n=1 Tax=Sphingosinicella terrae TaxID=2172047 RepID=UPI000E0DB0A6|nr:TonB-dependent receptor [Sphingosinicella terrae]
MSSTSRLSIGLKLGTAFAALIAAAPALAQDEETQVAAANVDGIEESAGDEEILVTARRRSESLQDVPISVTALDGETLEDQGATDLTAVMQRTPNTTLQIARGSNSTLIGFIRGVGQQDPLWGFEPGVGLYLDDVYVARPQAAVLDIFDVERIEVLRGPQGTLYGRNTIGGAVKYVTRRLGNEFSGRVRASYGSYDQIDLVGSVTAPVTDTLSVGGAVAWLQRDGYGENLNTGTEHYNKDVLAARASIEFAPTSDLFFRLAGDWIRDTSNARHAHRLIGNAGIPAYDPPADEYDTRAGAGDPNEVETRGISLLAEWNVDDRVTLKSITAYRDGETEGNIDFDGTPLPTLDIPAFYEDDQFSQEFQIVYEGDRLQGVAGVYYLDGHAAGAFDTVLGNAGLTIFTAGSVDTRSLAAFADFSYNLSDRWRVSLGGRYTSDRREGTVFRQTLLGLRSPFFGNEAAVPLTTNTDYTNTREDDQFTPRASLSFLPTPDVTLYASYSKGYKSGGFDMRGDASLTPNTVNGYDPETVDAYEVGLKAYALDRALYFSVAGFYSDYQDQQVTVQVPVGTNVASFVNNAADSRIWGLEAEVRANITDAFSVSAMFGYTNADFKRVITFDPVTQQDVDVSDIWGFQNTPEFNFAVAPTYVHDLGGGGTLTFAPSISYRSSYQQFEVPNALLDEDGYTLVDAAIVWTSADQRFQVSAVGRNLADERYRIGGYNFPGALFGNSIVAFYGPPRTFTITGEVRF